MNNTIGANILKYRKMNGMSQQYLAGILGISSQGLLKIEKGMVSPRINTVEKICDTLCITPNQLFGLEEMGEENVSLLVRLKRMSNLEKMRSTR
jgi:Predicted transcriptional regulators